jgi:hypothetical protein
MPTSSGGQSIASQNRLIKATCDYAEQCIKKMEPSGDPSVLKDLCEAINKLAATMNKMPMEKEKERDEKSTESLVADMGDDEK